MNNPRPTTTHHVHESAPIPVYNLQNGVLSLSRSELGLAQNVTEMNLVRIHLNKMEER